MRFPAGVAIDYDERTILEVVHRHGMYSALESAHEAGNSTAMACSQNDEEWIVACHILDDGTCPDAGWMMARFPKHLFAYHQVHRWMIEALESLI